MVKPRVLILTGRGIDCGDETKFAFESAGAETDKVHIDDLIKGNKKLKEYQILALPIEDSYDAEINGVDIYGAGTKSLIVNKIKTHFLDELKEFVKEDKLAIGICDGFRVMVELGLLPTINGEYAEGTVELLPNKTANNLDRWVDLQFHGSSIWVEGIKTASLPITHINGRFYASDKTLLELNKKGLVAAKYFLGMICCYQDLEPNPTGSLEEIAGITDETGRIIGMMPHPEKAINFTQIPNWKSMCEGYLRTGLEVPKNGPALKIFENAVKYFN